MNRVKLLTGAAILAISAGVMAQVKSQMPADVGPGRVAWFDITTTDLSRAKAFYQKMFDWTFTALKGTNQAVEINSRGNRIGTLRTAEGAISGFNGVVYIQVDDVRSASEKAKTLGGTGAISLIRDPSGHPLGLYSRALMPAKTL